MGTTIELPDRLADKVETLVRSGDYASISEFTRDATRRRLEKYAVCMECGGVYGSSMNECPICEQPSLSPLWQ